MSPQTENTQGIFTADSLGKGKLVFFTSTTVIPVTPADITSPLTPAFLREAFTPHRRRRPSFSSQKSKESGSKDAGDSRYFSFAFDIPPGREPGQEMPPSFSASALVETGTRGRAFAEKAEVNYKVTAIWEPSDGFENRAL